MQTVYRGFKLKAFGFAIFTALCVAALDQFTKAVVTHYLAMNDTVEVIPQLFNIVYVKNPGAAFGIFREGGMIRTILLISISVIAIVIIAFLLGQSKDRLTDFSLSLIAGGAMGNLIDRIQEGDVVDFLDFYVGSYHWPAFNIADSAITVGVILSLICFHLRRHEN